MTPPTRGELNWDGPLNDALNELQRQITAGSTSPGSAGFAGWTFDPAMTVASIAPVAGTLYLARVDVRNPAHATRIVWGVNTTGAGPVAGQSEVALYTSTGALLEAVEVSSHIGTLPAQQAITTTIDQQLDPGFYWVGWVINAATLPTIVRGSGQAAVVVNAGITDPTQMRYATNGTGLTSAPAPIDPSQNVPSAFTFWAAIG